MTTPTTPAERLREAIRLMLSTFPFVLPETMVVPRKDLVAVLMERDRLRAACETLDGLDWIAGYEMVQHERLQAALDAARAALSDS